jgi:glutathione S-transferase
MDGGSGGDGVGHRRCDHLWLLDYPFGEPPLMTARPRLRRMTKPKLTYFDLPRSRGEECRLALFLSGVDFEDNRIASTGWSALKPATPFGSLPTFEVPGKPVVSQSNAILGYLGRQYGLLPSDPWEAMRHESLLSAVEDLRHVIGRTFGIQDKEELARKRAELVAGPVKAWATNVEKQIVGPFVGGEAISVADIKVYILMGWLMGGVLDYVPRDVFAGFEKLEKLYDSVHRHPKVVAWRARPGSGHSS